MQFNYLNEKRCFFHQLKEKFDFIDDSLKDKMLWKNDYIYYSLNYMEHYKILSNYKI